MNHRFHWSISFLLKSSNVLGDGVCWQRYIPVDDLNRETGKKKNVGSCTGYALLSWLPDKNLSGIISPHPFTSILLNLGKIRCKKKALNLVVYLLLAQFIQLIETGLQIKFCNKGCVSCHLVFNCHLKMCSQPR